MYVWLGYRLLYERQPLFRVGLVPYAIYIAASWVADGGKAVVFHVLEEGGIRLVEAVVRAVMLQAKRLLNGRKTLELDDGRVVSHFFHLLAILYVDVGGRILLVVLNGEAVSRRGTFAAKALHLRAYGLAAERAEGFVAWYNGTM